MRIFYQADIVDNPFLDEQESKHCIKVLRMQVGDEILIIDGKGNFVTCSIKDTQSKKCELTILSIQKEEKRDYKIHLAVAPTKNIDRTEWVIEKCIELGVDKITFLLCKTSERKVLKLDRIERIAISAMKQSGKATLPEITELLPMTDFWKTVQEENKLIAHLNEDDLKYIGNSNISSASHCILIGPEGDFTEKEVDQAIKNGFVPVSLGRYRLRTETAAIAAIQEIHAIKRFLKIQG